MSATITALNPIQLKGFVQHLPFGGVPMYARRDERFHTRTISIFLQTPLARDTATPVALLPGLLRRGTATLPSQRELAQRLEDLYGASIGLDVFRVGDRQVLTADLMCLEDHALPSGAGDIGATAVGLLHDVLFDPALDASGQFAADSFNVEQELLGRRLDALVNDKFSLALQRLFAMLGEGTSFGVSEIGDRKVLVGVTRERATQVWRNLTHHAPIALFSVGAQPVDDQIDQLVEAFRASVGSRETYPLEPLQVREVPQREPRLALEEVGAEQAWLLLGYRTGVSFASRDSAALSLLDALVGRTMSSRLFRRVREELGLAYDVGSFLERHEGLMVLYAGLDADGVDECRAAIDGELASLAAGEISDDEFELGLQSLREVYQLVPDTRGSWVHFLFARKVAGIAEHPDDVLRQLDRVTKADVAARAKALRLDAELVLR